MRIEYEVKLGFKDVLIRPKRSTLKSRSQVDLNRTYTFRHTKKSWTGVPVIAANMDTVGTFEMAQQLAQKGLITAIHKHYSTKEWSNFLHNKNDRFYDNIMISTGASKSDFSKMSEIIKKHPKIKFICIE